MRVTPLNWPRNEPSKICSGGCCEGDGASMLAGECVQEPGGKDPGAGGALGGMEEFALVLLDEDGHQGEELQAENPSFFHFEGFDSHGESDGVDDHPNPDDDDGGALALVWGCIQAELSHEVQEMMVIELG